MKPNQRIINCDLCTGGPECLNDCKIQAPGGCMAGEMRDDIPGKPYSEAKSVAVFRQRCLLTLW